MSYLKDEILVAYADNALGHDERRAVETMLACDPSGQRSVSLFRLTRVYILQIFAEIDFSKGAFAGTDVLDTRHLAAPQGPRKFMKMNSLGWSIPFAAGLAAAVVGVGWALVLPGATESRFAKASPTALGPVQASSTLSKVLNHPEQTGAVWTLKNGSRVAEVTAFKDKFGNSCRELELFGSASVEVPIEVLVACRFGPASWSVVGAVMTKPAGQAAQPAYVPNVEEARSAMASVLSMIGAQQRTSAAQPEFPTP